VSSDALRQRAKKFAGLLVILSIVLVVVVITSFSPRPSGPGAALHDLHTLADLQADFNHHAGEPRLVLLLSPT